MVISAMARPGGQRQTKSEKGRSRTWPAYLEDYVRLYANTITDDDNDPGIP